MAAQWLRRQGIAVTVLDKANRPGGRMATRPFEGAIFDYGAQFFTVRHERFASYQRAWETKGLVRVWSNGFNGVEDGHPRYIGQTGMNSIPTHLAQGLDVRSGVQVSRISEHGAHWNLDTDFDEVLMADALIVTVPAPQAVQLLEKGDVPVAEALRRIEYDRCLALMANLDAPADLPDPGVRQIDSGEPVSWIADNRRKGISQASNSVTIHAGPAFSLEYWDKDPDCVAAKLLNGYSASAWKLHRWKYSKPRVLHPERFLVAGTKTPLLFAGDGFGEARVEGAALSGLAAAERMLGLL